MLPHFLEPKVIIEAVGLIGILLVVFAESGLFFGFFLPGDSLLFTAGLFASQGYFDIAVLALGCALAAIAGDSVGYAFGKRVGPRLFNKEDSVFFHKKHLERASAFYERHGVKTIVLARFVPIVRTFAPIVAGMGGMKYRIFFAYNVIGGIVWAVGFTVAGYFLGNVIPGIDRHLEVIIIGIIALSLVPVALEWLKERRRTRREPPAPVV